MYHLAMNSRPYPLTLIPQYRHYVWGGTRLKQDSQPVAEAWVVYAENQISGGELDGLTLAQATQTWGEQLLGAGRTGSFPLLIKLLDTAQWLSLQLHPNDEEARRLEGAHLRGKEEAWHVLAAADGAELIAGFKTGVSPKAAVEAIRSGEILDLINRQRVHGGDTILIRPGMIHALGPNLLIYEIQQSSDITYRVYDWGRPPSDGRPLHIEKSVEVVKPALTCHLEKYQPKSAEERHILTRSEHFILEELVTQGQPVALATGNKTFHALTVIEGAYDLLVGGEALHLNQFETALVPSACNAYSVTAQQAGRLLLARLP